MPVDANTLRLLVEAGVTGDKLIAIVASLDAFMAPVDETAERRRAWDRDRKRKGKSGIPSGNSGGTDEEISGGNRVEFHRNSHARVRGSSSSEVDTGKKDRGFFEEPTPEKATPRSELERVLDPLRAKAVVEARQRLKKPLTAHAASLLAKKFASVPDPNAAADLMVEKGWQGFEPEYLNGRSATGPPKKKTDQYGQEI